MRPRLAIVLSHPIQHFCPLYAEWAKSGSWDIHVFFASTAGAAPYIDSGFLKPVSWSGLRLSHFPHTFLNGPGPIEPTPSIDSIALEHALEEFRPQALLTYGYRQRLQRRAQSWARRRRVPIVYFADSELRQRRTWWRTAAKRILLPSRFRNVSCFLVTGNANEQYYTHYGVPHSRMIRASYPLDRELYLGAYASRDAHRMAARAQLGLSNSDFVVLMVGKLVEWKRQVDLIRATPLSGGSPATTLLVGTGPMDGELRSVARRIGAEKQSIFAGFSAPEALPAMYAAADIYVHASSIEPHSVAISEAGFMGLPIVVSDRCGSYGTDDDVRPGENGIVYPCGDVNALARAIRRLREQPELRRIMGERSHEIARQQQEYVYRRALPALREFLCL